MIRKSLAAARCALFGAVAVCLLAAGECGYLEKQRVERAVTEAAAAAAAGDAAGFLDMFAPDYNDDWVPAEQAQAKLKARFAQPPLPTLSFGKREIQITGDRAIVTEWFTIEDQVEGRSRRYEEIQHLLLERRAEGWKCISGSKLLSLLGGRMEEEHAIEQVLFRREAALVKEDVNSYLELISPDYRHKGESVEDLRERVLQIFRVYDDIEFRSFDRKIYYLGAAAEVQQKFSMTAVQMGKPMSFSGEERFELIKTDQGWKFTKGL
jgi:ketosteroid isomerase-like protein